MDEKKARKLMKEKLKDLPNVIEHSEAVAKKAVEIAEKLKKKGFSVDVEIVKIGALLHDIGRSVTHGVRHGIEGSEMLKELKYPEEICKIVERHLGGGIPKDEAVDVGLPARDYLPETLEEKIVGYADKIHDDYKMNRIIKKFEEMFGKDSDPVKRLKKLKDEMEQLLSRGEELI